MNSIKNSVVIALLLGVAYGAFQVINAPEPDAGNIDSLPADGEIKIPATSSLLASAEPPGASAPPLESGDRAATSAADDGPGFGPPPTMPRLTIDEIDPNSGSEPAAPPIAQTGSGNRYSAHASQAPSQPDQTNPGLHPMPSNLNKLEPSSRLVEIEKPTSRSAGSLPPTIDWARIGRLVEQQNYKSALAVLSQHHRAHPNSPDRQEILNWLDSLALKVIYSSEHHLRNQPHSVQPGETIEQIASRWNVPAQLVYRINQASIPDPNQLQPGTELKVIPGPFDAEIDQDQAELTLYVRGLYAGRFQIEIGSDAQLTKREMRITSKSDAGRLYQAANGDTIAANSPGNPYGQYWFGLDANTSIHSVASSVDSRGCIRLTNAQDAADLFGILSTDSRITIR